MGESLKFSFTRGTRFGWVIRLAVLCLAINIVLLWHISWDYETSGVISPYTSQSEARVSKRLLRRDSNSRGVADFLDSYGPPLPVTESKRWPSLTNGRPWEVAYQTGCEAYYGNGFFKLFTFSNLKSDKPASAQASGLQAQGGAAQWGEGVPGWFRCRQNSALLTSICEGGRVAMHTARVHMSRGGEPVGSVVGRTENEELPSFDQGAFEILAGEGSLEGDSQSVASDFVVDALLPQGHIAIHVMSKLLNAMRIVPTINCTQVVTEPTLFVARYEYANLFHTTTDWYSAYVTARVSGFDVPPRVVFLDGHAQSPLDDCWRALFPSITLAKQLEGTVCFEHAMFVPLGYTTAMFEAVNTGNGAHCVGCAPGAESGGAALLEAKEGNAAARGLGEGQVATARLREFGEVVSRVWGGDHRPWSWAHWKAGETRAHFGTPIDARETDLHVLFVRREDYLAHPRHAGQVEKRLDNEDEVLVALRFWAAEWAGVSDYREIEESVGSKKGGGGHVVIENGRLAHMTFKEQMSAVHRAAVIVGAHGAGMTHLVFARPGTEIVEIMTPLFQRPHFERLSAWRGDVHYQSIQCSTQSVEPAEVVTAIRSIATRLLGQPPSLQATAG